MAINLPDSEPLPERSLTKSYLMKLGQTIFPDREFLSILKFELSLLVVALYSKLSPVELFKTIRRQSASDLKINVGAGPFRHEGWLNVDCRLSFGKDDVVCDLRRRWPLPEGSAKYIFSEHVFEHFAYPDQIGHVLRECYRILQPGGVLRIIVPDAERYLRAYATDDETFLRQVSNGSVSKIAVVNVMMRENGFHRYAYDYPELKEILTRAGFVNVNLSSLRASRHPELNLDLDDGQREHVSLYVEAVK